MECIFVTGIQIRVTSHSRDVIKLWFHDVGGICDFFLGNADPGTRDHFLDNDYATVA